MLILSLTKSDIKNEPKFEAENEHSKSSSPKNVRLGSRVNFSIFRLAQGELSEYSCK